MQDNPKLKKMILQVINNQIGANDPPETKRTLNRLISNGYSKEQAKELIASVLVKHIYTILKNEEYFDEAQYTKDLKNLPELPNEE